MLLKKNFSVDFESVYSEYSDMLYRVALSHLGSQNEAEDAVHDVFVKYFENPPKFNDGEHIKAWLIRSTVNRCIDLKRRRAVRSYVPLDEIGEIADRTPASAEESVIELVSSLDEKYKSVIILHCLEGLSVAEVAKTLSLSVSAVKMRLVRGREILKKQM